MCTVVIPLAILNLGWIPAASAPKIIGGVGFLVVAVYDAAFFIATDLVGAPLFNKGAMPEGKCFSIKDKQQ